ncbi:MAG: hypothetical protein COZ18_08835 [Flexibacter sp. CG_4_10_14_3_um_filter_32_15]|nr:MAG: hypothetical protein COZ18_08835 [Flexibacter sp. CG_4_10_14_3_um_filter_32_15]
MKNIFKRLYSLLIVSILAISLTSCFDLKEEVTINNDGSGSFIQTIDMGNNPMIQMALNMQSDSAKDANNRMNKMDSTMEETKTKLSQVKGISNVKIATSTEGLKYTIMYDFADVDALNRAINATKEEKEGEVKIMEKLYSFKKGKFTRANSFSMGDNGMDMSELMGSKKGDDDTEQTEEEKAQMKQMMQMFFGNANYTYIVHVPNKVKSYSNKANTTVSEDQKTLTMTIPFMELLGDDKKVDIGNSVKFK